MHLRNVEIFCDVVTHGSFSKAALENEVSQSSASQAVHMLEKRLGCRLIDRSKRPFELTAAGQIYYDGCRKILESFRHVEDRVQQMRNKVIGRVRMAAIYSVGLLQMDTYAKRYKTQFPDVVLQLDYLHPDEVYSRVLNDESRLGNCVVSAGRERNRFDSLAKPGDGARGAARAIATPGRPSVARRRFGRRDVRRLYLGADDSQADRPLVQTGADFGRFRPPVR